MLKSLYATAKDWWTKAGFESVGFFGGFLLLSLFGKDTLATAALTIFIYINAKVIWSWIVKGAKALWTKE